MSRMLTGGLGYLPWLLDFRVVTALSILMLKLTTKVLVRGLADRQGLNTLGESFAFLGVDIAILGFSLVLGAVASETVKLGNREGALEAILILFCLVCAVLSYGYHHQPGSRMKQWLAMLFSWAFGSVPFTTALEILSRATKV